MKELFTVYQCIDPEESMNSTAFWHWLKTQNRDDIDIFTSTLEDYLPRDFRLKTHYISAIQLRYHKHVFDHFHRSEFGDQKNEVV